MLWVEPIDRAVGFDAPGARYPHQDPKGRCSFETLVEEYHPDHETLPRAAFLYAPLYAALVQRLAR